MNLSELVELIKWMVNGTLDLFLHGVYSGLAFWLSFSLTLWVTRLTYIGAAYLLHSRPSMTKELEGYTQRLGYSVGLFVCVSVHLWQDGLLGIY